MSITNEATFLSLRDYPYEHKRVYIADLNILAARLYSGWLVGSHNGTGVAPTTAVIPTSATVGSVGQQSPGGTLRLLKANFSMSYNVGGGLGMVTICDRLSHQAGLSGLVPTPQTTNLPTAALTRKTSGVGVEAGLEIYTSVGSTATTATITYTNTVPTAGQVSPTVTFGGTGYNALGRFIAIPLASGDKGVTAVADVTLGVSTLTAGNFGVTLYYPLVSIPIDHLMGLNMEAGAMLGFGPWFPVVDSSSCLWNIYTSITSRLGLMIGELGFAQDA